MGGVHAEVDDLERRTAVPDDPPHPDGLALVPEHHAVPGVGQRGRDRRRVSVGEPRVGPQAPEDLDGRNARDHFVRVSHCCHALQVKGRVVKIETAAPPRPAVEALPPHPFA